MIFECPTCNTTHSKPERDIGSGTVVKCRRCSHEFRVSPDGVSELTAPGAATADPPEAHSPLVGALPPDVAEFDDNSSAPKVAPGRDRPVLSEFHQARTEIMEVPPSAARAAQAAATSAAAGDESGFALQTVQASSDFIKKNLAAMQDGEPTVPTDAAAAETADGSTPAIVIPAPASPPESSVSEQATAITTPAELRSPAGRRPSAPQPAAASDDKSEPDLSVPGTFAELEKEVPAPRPSRPSGRLAADGGLARRLSGEQRPGRPSRSVARRGFPPFPRRALEE